MGVMVEHPSIQSIVPDPSGSDEHFDRHVLGRMVLQACSEAVRLSEPVADRLGLGSDDLCGLLRYLELDGGNLVDVERHRDPDEEEVMVRALLVENCSLDGPVGPWLAGILARRALEPNHLWEDLGLATRPDLSKLLLRHFSPIAGKNTRNMRWKKFLYRSLCEAEGFSMCPSPTCDACPEFDICYGDDSGESALARNARQAKAAA
jgi:nitrogen fixation protein NifQ